MIEATFRLHAARLRASPCAGCCAIAPSCWACFVAVLGVTAYLYVIVPKGFIPDTDNDNFNVTVEAAQGTSYYQMVKYQRAGFVHRGAGSGCREFLLHARAAATSDASGATGRLMVNLKPRRQRKATVAEIVNRTPPQTCRHSRPARFHLHSRRHPRRRTHVQERLRLHALRSGHRRSSTTEAPKLGTRHRRACPACRKSPAICKSRTRASTSYSTATAPPP